ncbi:hypothetical protein [Pseudoalteromonas sp. KAN5]|uniref:hypothetical protein n=1 Tax=Pseudoalteromonas sp. KAN5 TaxID=2916633 RepID=UPI001FCBAC9C|nr:hypothetical protein [Pseudoalteromonas sp. KAN5]BDF93700.1 hypothetical protein KAN5_05380 [Pseudoalteromonas sp. KAN5]
MEEFTNSIDDELRAQFSELSKLTTRKLAIIANIRYLKKEKAEREGKGGEKLSDEQLYYLISYVLEQPVPATKLFGAGAEKFQKDENWCQKVIRFAPLAEQVKRILHRLELDSNYHFMLLLKYRLFKQRKLLRCTDYRSFFNLLKSWAIIVGTLAKKDEEIQRLNSLVEHFEVQLKRNSLCLQTIERTTPKEHAILLNKEFPNMTYKDIAGVVGVSRQTVSNYIKNSS